MPTYRNPLLDEIWEIKDRLARESGNDLGAFCDQLQAWSAAHPHSGPVVVRNAAELRALLASRANTLQLGHQSV